MNLVDTSGWIEYFFSEPNASHFAKPIENISDLMVPTICLYEVFKKVNVVADEAQALQAVAQMRQGRVIDLTEDIALSASLISIKHKLPMADSMIYATAKAREAVVWTQDEDFHNLPGVNFKAARTKGSSVHGKQRR
ncbi:MAG: type II toxin-antitoxin system VapC family toxin [Deltaproteobacteria bacterium]|nr:type II toxin-antitoxin system VapC family toxin [Deltaproteobacteria bacterium]